MLPPSETRAGTGALGRITVASARSSVTDGGAISLRANPMAVASNAAALGPDLAGMMRVASSSVLISSTRLVETGLRVRGIEQVEDVGMARHGFLLGFRQDRILLGVEQGEDIAVRGCRVRSDLGGRRRIAGREQGEQIVIRPRMTFVGCLCTRLGGARKKAEKVDIVGNDGRGAGADRGCQDAAHRSAFALFGASGLDASDQAVTASEHANEIGKPRQALAHKHLWLPRGLGDPEPDASQRSPRRWRQRSRDALLAANAGKN